MSSPNNRIVGQHAPAAQTLCGRNIILIKYSGILALGADQRSVIGEMLDQHP